MFTNYNKVLLHAAYKACNNGEIPVSAIAVMNGNIIAKACNNVEKTKDKTAHAEMLLLRKIKNKLGHSNFIDDNISIYVTLEPCAMCMAALSMCRIKTIFYFLDEPKFGGLRIFTQKSAYFRPDIYHIPNAEYEELFKSFFQKLR